MNGASTNPRAVHYYYRARYYDPSIGRFLSEDPGPAVNPYPYVLNDPVDFTDPTGREVAIERAFIATFVLVGVILFLPILQQALSKIIVSLYALISDAIGGIQANYAKSGRQNVKSDRVVQEAIRRAASTGHDEVCAALQEMYQEARAAKNFKEAEVIKATQKALGCRGHG